MAGELPPYRRPLVAWPYCSAPYGRVRTGYGYFRSEQYLLAPGLYQSGSKSGRARILSVL